MTTPNNHVLIDYENVQREVASRQRPASIKTLQGSIAALFQPKLIEVEAMGLVEQLKRTGVVAMDGVSKVRYGLPDDA